jgi:hypothetical protein
VVDGSPSGGDAVVLASQLARGTSAERMLTGCRRGGLICEADGCRRIILTIGSHQRNRAEYRIALEEAASTNRPDRRWYPSLSDAAHGTRSEILSAHRLSNA